MVLACSWHPTRPVLATGSADGTVRLWDFSADNRKILKQTTNAGILAMGDEELQRQSRRLLETCVVLDPDAPNGIGQNETQSSSQSSAENADEKSKADLDSKRRKTTSDKERKREKEKAREQDRMVKLEQERENMVEKLRQRTVTCLDWSTKGNKLAVGTFEGFVHLYSTPNHSNFTPRIIRTFNATSSNDDDADSSSPVHIGPVSIVKFNPGKSDRLLTCGTDGTVFVWDVSSGDVVLSMQSAMSFTQSTPSSSVSLETLPLGPVLDADWRDANVFAFAGSAIPGSTPFNSATFSLASNTVVPSTVVPSVDSEQKKDKKDKKDADNDKADISSKQASELNQAGADHSVFICSIEKDIADPVVLRLSYAHAGDINSLRWCPFGITLATGSDDGLVKLWRPQLKTSSSTEVKQESTQTSETGELSHPSLAFVSLPTRHNTHLLHTLVGHERGVTSVRFNDVGPLSPSVLSPIPATGDINSVLGVDQSNQMPRLDGTMIDDKYIPLLMLASSSLDTTVRIWDPVTGLCRCNLSRHVHPVAGIAWAGAISPNASLPDYMADEVESANKEKGFSHYRASNVIASYAHGRVLLWDVRDGSIIRTFRTDASVGDISWWGNSQFAVASSDGCVYMMDVKP